MLLRMYWMNALNVLNELPMLFELLLLRSEVTKYKMIKQFNVT